MIPREDRPPPNDESGFEKFAKGGTTGSLGVELNQAEIPEGEDRLLPDHESGHGSLMVELDQPTRPQWRTTDRRVTTRQSQELKGLSYIDWRPEMGPRLAIFSTRKAVKRLVEGMVRHRTIDGCNPGEDGLPVEHPPKREEPSEKWDGLDTGLKDQEGEDGLGPNFQRRPKIEVTKSCGKLDLKGEMMLWNTSIYKTRYLLQAPGPPLVRPHGDEETPTLTRRRGGPVDQERIGLRVLTKSSRDSERRGPPQAIPCQRQARREEIRPRTPRDLEEGPPRRGATTPTGGEFRRTR
ncbi:hypothetical protein BC827DRAFT_1154897 [Russula dissimulans]|nr:hypothetical protein BC827DRAFT_1154897 [Russula dissimulans]